MTTSGIVALVAITLVGVTSGIIGSIGVRVARSTSDFLATSDGLALTKAFVRITDAKLRRRIVDLVEQIAGEE